MKNENKKLIIWVVIALVIGTIIGGFLISPTTIGNANTIFSRKNNKPIEITIQSEHSTNGHCYCPDHEFCTETPNLGCACCRDGVWSGAIWT
jgi:hypothetical protein